MNNSTAKKSITVLIVEDFPLTAKGLQATVQTMEKCRLTGVASTPEEARRIAMAEHPDVITLDLRLGGSTAAGIQLARDLRILSPNSRILVFSGFVRDRDVRSLLGIGIEGYLTKDEPPSAVTTAIRAVASGQTFFSRPVSQVVKRIQAGGASLLGPGDAEVLRLVAKGLTNEEIAHHLSVSRPTATRRLATIFRILDATTRAEAVAKAADLGYLDSG